MSLSWKYFTKKRLKQREAGPLRRCLSLLYIQTRKRPSLVIGVVVLISVAAVLLATPLASAKTLSQMSPTEQAKSWLYYNSLSACISAQNLSSGGNGDRISPADASAGKWFRNPGIGATNPTIGYFLTGAGLSSSTSGDKVGCGGNDIAWISDAASLWGYSSPIDLLCSAGASRTNGSDCRDGSGEFQGVASGLLRLNDKLNLDSFQQSVKSKVYGGDNPSRSDAARYIHARNAFYVGCLGGASPAVYTGSANDSYVYSVDVVDPTTGAKTTQKFYGVKRSGDSIGYSISPGMNNVTATCGELVSQMKSYASSYSLYVKSTQDGDVTGGVVDSCTNEGECAEAVSTCTIENVGWILCPVMTLTAKVVDAAYTYVSSLLEVQPFMTTGNTSGAYEAWVIMRNIANICFVIAFLIIIFSQLTGVGVSNYGVKKLLPRLVVSAILVNASYIVTAAAVDISNILGSSVSSLFTTVGAQIGPPVVDSLDTGSGWTSFVGAALAGSVAAGAIYYAGLSALIPALLAAVIAIVTVFIVLTLRQALIILLVVIAPLAFVAYLLPNTEQLFSKWRKLLMTLLLMFPIIAAIFGASALASQIVMQSADGEYKTVIQIMGACISIIPLALTPIVMKTAGGLLNRFAGIVNNAERGPIDRLRKAGSQYREGRQNLRNARALAGERQFGRGAFTKWQVRRKAITNGQQSELGRATTDYVAEQVQKNQGFQNAIAGGTAIKSADTAAAQRALASSIQAQDKLEGEELHAAKIVLKDATLSQEQSRILANGGSVTTKNTAGVETVLNGGTSEAVRAAAIQRVVESNDIDGINGLWNASKTWEGESGKKLRNTFADSLQSSSARPAYIGQGPIAGLRENAESHGDIKKTIESAIKANAYSADRIASADKDELNVVAQVLKESHDLAAQGQVPPIDDNARQQIMLNAERALTDPILSNKVSKNKERVQEIASFREPADHEKVEVEGTIKIAHPASAPAAQTAQPQTEPRPQQPLRTPQQQPTPPPTQPPTAP